MNLVPSFILQVVNALSIASTKYVSAYLILSITGSEVHPENAELLIVVTESGITIDVNLEQSLNAFSLIEVTPVKYLNSSKEVNASVNSLLPYPYIA